MKQASEQHLRTERSIRIALIQARMAENLLQQSVTDSLKWVSQSLSAIERGVQKLTVLDLLALCEHYRIEPARLLTVAESLSAEMYDVDPLHKIQNIALAQMLKSGIRG